MMKTGAVYKMQAIGELQNICGKCVSKLKNMERRSNSAGAWKKTTPPR